MRFEDLGPEIQQLITHLNIPEAALDHISVKDVARVYEDLGQAERIFLEAAAAAAAASHVAQQRTKRAGTARRPFQDVTNVLRTPETGGADLKNGGARKARNGRDKEGNALSVRSTYSADTCLSPGKEQGAPVNDVCIPAVGKASGPTWEVNESPNPVAVRPLHHPAWSADTLAADCLDIACPSPLCSFQLLLDDDSPTAAPLSGQFDTPSTSPEKGLHLQGPVADSPREGNFAALHGHYLDLRREQEGALAGELAAKYRRRLQRLVQDLQRVKTAKDSHKEAARQWAQRAKALESAQEADEAHHRAEVARLQKQLTARDEQLLALQAVLENSSSKPRKHKSQRDQKRIRELEAAVEQRDCLLRALGARLQGQFGLLLDSEDKSADLVAAAVETVACQSRRRLTEDTVRCLEEAIRKQAALLSDDLSPFLADQQRECTKGTATTSTELQHGAKQRAAASPSTSAPPIPLLTEQTAVIRQRYEELQQLRQEREHLVEQVRLLQGLSAARRTTSSMALLLAAQTAGMHATPQRGEQKATPPWKPPGP